MLNCRGPSKVDEGSKPRTQRVAADAKDRSGPIEGELDDKKIRLTEITVSTANATAKGLKNRIFSRGQGRRGSWKP
jgi:hypothetical protein